MHVFLTVIFTLCLGALHVLPIALSKFIGAHAHGTDLSVWGLIIEWRNLPQQLYTTIFINILK